MILNLFICGLNEEVTNITYNWMSAVVIQRNQENSSEWSCKRLPVRLRLKKTSNLGELMIPVANVLKNRNAELSNNINCLSQLSKSSPLLNPSIKVLFEEVRKHFQEKSKRKNRHFNLIMKKLRQQLHFLHTELSPIITQPEIQSTPKTDSQITSRRLSEQTFKQIQKQYAQGQEEMLNFLKRNKQLSTQVSEMQQYIVELKDSLKEKDNIICELEHKITERESQIISFKEELGENTRLLSVMHEEIAGYETKIEQQDRELQAFRKQKGFVKNKSEVIIAEVQKLEFKQTIQGEQKSEEEQISSRDDQANKLQQIYENTQMILKKCKMLEQELEIKQQFQDNILNVLEKLELSSKQMLTNASEEDMMSTISTSLDQIIQKIIQQYNERQSKIQQMLNTHLDQTITAIQSQIQNLTKLPSHFTAIDKINYLRQIIQTLIKPNSPKQQPISQPILQIIDNRLEQIMIKSEVLKADLTENNNKLNNICEKLDIKSEGFETFRSLGMLEELLVLNQEALRNQDEGYSVELSRKTVNNQQANQYLQQLETTIRQIQEKQKKTIQSFTEQRQKLKSQIQQLLKFNENLTFKLTQITNQLKKIKDDEDIKAIQQELILLNSRLKNSSSRLNRDIFSATTSVLSEQRMKIQLETLQAKYFQQGCDFIQVVLRKIRDIKDNISEDKFYEFVEFIFRQVQIRDDSLREEMSRRRELMKQRRAIVSQICNQGLRGTSRDNLKESA